MIFRHKTCPMPCVSTLKNSGLQLIYDSKITLGKTSSPVSGTMSAQEALGTLLAGSGLSASFSGNGTVIITAGGMEGVPSLGVVRVEGAGGNGHASGVNGINGSRDTEATEGTGSYTTGAVSIGTKDAQSIKETPASITVLTAQNIADQNITDLKQALNQMSGVSLVQSAVGNGDSRRGAGFDEAQFYSRGFEITSFQIDGGAPINTGNGFYTGGSLYTPTIDLSEYDSVQLLRGADGLFNGYGDPGGTINLVRKKPLDHDQLTADAQFGSYHDYRGVVDLTGPIGFDGHLRARAVGTYEDTDYFYKVAHSTKNLFYGIVEADLTPTTLIDAGMDYTHQFGTPDSYGLPRFVNGSSLNLPTSTCLCFPWSHSDFKTTSYFVDFNQKFGKDWGLKVKGTRLIQTVDSKYAYIYGSINPAKNTTTPTFARFSPQTREWAADATLNGAFMLFGQRQEILAGANYQYSDSGGTVGYSSFSLSPINVFTFSPTDPTNPDNFAPADRGIASRFNKLGSTQWDAYGNIRFTPFKGLHLISGIRYTKFNSFSNIQNGICDVISTFCPTIGQISTIYALFKLPSLSTSVNASHNIAKPNLSAIYDVTKNLSAYGTYARIYQPQYGLVTADGTVLPPVTGRNLEGGVKWQAPGGTLNATLALYSTIKEGVGLRVGADNSTAFPGYDCCFVLGGALRQTSKGLDLDIAGRLAPGLQVTAGYTFNENKQTGTGNSLTNGAPIITTTPRNLIKFFATYNLRGSDWDRRFTFGGGVNYQSSSYSTGQGYLYTNDPVTGLPTVQVANSAQYFAYTIAPYAIVQLRMAFKVSDKAELSFNLTNLLNAVTYQSTGNLSYGNYYVQPRTFTLALHAKL